MVYFGLLIINDNKHYINTLEQLSPLSILENLPEVKKETFFHLLDRSNYFTDFVMNNIQLPQDPSHIASTL